ncbi:lipopolysaccharide transport periplasmic protein LptA [Sessilibacter corallicola]|uniref:lipopolysaccharide transport periplasmic protein LptA n=1 Tax=Sessilibacter corallicola TaxID=2904075 RepID=UPI001E5F38BF|nr:lipopolysaccharide transport periplasmic protein LptA [Sessilibacter corallicola]MCE2027148.1 lipopolysaccharide transport periplasmic protein LptA [Sessilibacter corallicola]
MNPILYPKRFLTMKSFSKLACFISLLAFTSLSNALPSDRNQPIEIDAERAERNDKTGVTTFIGNATLTQGTLKISADFIRVKQNPSGVDNIVAEGQPAKFQQQPEANEPLVKAEAEKILYSVAKETVNLSVNAQIDRGDGSTINSDSIDYDIRESHSVASGDSGVKIVIQPQTEENSGNEQ